MKKLLKFSLMLFVATFILSSCSSDDDDDYDTVISESSLPQTARTFVSQYFPSEKITLAKEGVVVNPITKTKYYVYLTNSYEIDFDSDGNWVEVELDTKDTTELPSNVLSLLPATALAYVRTNYPAEKIKSITRLTVNNQQRYEVDLSNGLDLTFSADGTFIGLDS